MATPHVATKDDSSLVRCGLQVVDANEKRRYSVDPKDVITEKTARRRIKTNKYRGCKRCQRKLV